MKLRTRNASEGVEKRGVVKATWVVAQEKILDAW